MQPISVDPHDIAMLIAYLSTDSYLSGDGLHVRDLDPYVSLAYHRLSAALAKPLAEDCHV